MKKLVLALCLLTFAAVAFAEDPVPPAPVLKPVTTRPGLPLAAQTMMKIAALNRLDLTDDQQAKVKADLEKAIDDIYTNILTEEQKKRAEGKVVLPPPGHANPGGGNGPIIVGGPWSVGDRPTTRPAPLIAAQTMMKIMALGRPNLNLTDDQTTKIKAALDKALDDIYTNVLTEEQKKKAQEQTPLRPLPGGPGPGRAGHGPIRSPAAPIPLPNQNPPQN